MAETTDDTKAQAKPVVIKKYANRRLYNTAASCYVTLDNLAEMVRDGVDFVVYDAKSGTDITRPVLTQIIVDAESKGHNLLPTSFLRQLIGFYGDSLQGLVPRYLDYSMRMFQNNEDRYRQYFNGALDGIFPISAFEEISRQNIAVFERAMQMFNPIAGDGATSDPPAPTTKASADTAEPDKARAAGGEQSDIDQLKNQLQSMQRQLDRLSHDRDEKS